MKIIECVPNFSEGRRTEVCDEIKNAVTSVAGVYFLDMEMDADHNRSVFTFAGAAESLEAAIAKAVDIAVKRIDLNNHKGAHPRMGAVDVIPFVPFGEATIEDCVELSRKVGKSVGERFQIPVYLYEKSASRADRVNLAEIRKPEFEGLRGEIGRNPDRVPDFGPNKIHPTAGCVAIGARIPLIAYNVYLKTPDVAIAKKIAKRVREKDGGLPTVKALGMFIATRNQAQVSMNLCNYSVTSILKAFEAVSAEAQKLGTESLSSEIVGLVPQSALPNDVPEKIKLEGFAPEKQILEVKLSATMK